MGNTVQKSGIRLIFVTLLGFLLIAVHFIHDGYDSRIELSEKAVLNNLKGITRTLALQIDGDAHASLITRVTKKDAIVDNKSNEDYRKIHQTLIQVKEINHLKTDIYTLFLDSLNGEKAFYFGVSTSENPYYRHQYKNYPVQLLENYYVGSEIPMFIDDHGTWLSAFYPVKNSEGKVVCVVQVDHKFDAFIKKTKEYVQKEMLISIAIFLLISSVVVIIILQIIKIEKKNQGKLNEAFAQVRTQNARIQNSINYAQKIQSAIIPTEVKIQDVFSDSFMLYKAKDVVSGDFPWMMKKDNYVFIAAVDCTGHGVPGAMMSFIGYFLLNEISNDNAVLTPAQILDRLHQGVNATLKQDDEGSSSSRDGMDVGLCRINLETNEVIYAGAHRPLYNNTAEGLMQFKGDKRAIGGRTHKKAAQAFTDHRVNVKKGESIFFFSDGLQDQFGGPEKIKYSPRRIRETIIENAATPMRDLKTVFENDFLKWKGEDVQIDDILLIGIRF